MFKGLHHFHVRKRIYKKYEPYPHPNKLKNAMDRLIYFIGIIGPLMTVPQIMNVWVYRSSEGVSVLTWNAFTVIAFFWVVYGVLHKEKPIIMTNILWMIFNSLIVAGVMLG